VPPILPQRPAQAIDLLIAALYFLLQIKHLGDEPVFCFQLSLKSCLACHPVTFFVSVTGPVSVPSGSWVSVPVTV
jgi:hypothetical protein